MLKREVELLESLTDLKDTDSIIKAGKGSSGMHPLDARYKGLGMKEMTPVNRNDDEFVNISEYLTKTIGATHAANYQVLDVFRIEREGETDRFESFAKKGSDRRLLWHGSRSTNYGGILSQGLRIAPPEAPGKSRRPSKAACSQSDNESSQRLHVWQGCLPCRHELQVGELLRTVHQ